MKKQNCIALLLAAIWLTSCLPALAESSQFEGLWHERYVVVQDGIGFNPAMLGFVTTLTLHADGTVEMIVEGNAQHCFWSADDDGVLLWADTPLENWKELTEIQLLYKDGDLVAEHKDTLYLFGRDSALGDELFSAGFPIAATAESFEGAWTKTNSLIDGMMEPFSVYTPIASIVIDAGTATLYDDEGHTIAQNISFEVESDAALLTYDDQETKDATLVLTLHEGDMLSAKGTGFVTNFERTQGKSTTNDKPISKEKKLAK